MSTNSTKVTIVAGARPNFMKIAPLIRALDRLGDAFDWRLVHTGQHYDREMNDVFFEELGIPVPDTSLKLRRRLARHPDRGGDGRVREGA